MRPRRLTKPIWVHSRQEHWAEACVKGWPERPKYLVERLAPGIDYWVVAGFPTWEEAMAYADQLARQETA